MTIDILLIIGAGICENRGSHAMLKIVDMTCTYIWFWIPQALDHAMSLTGLFAIQTKIFVPMCPNI